MMTHFYVVYVYKWSDIHARPVINYGNRNFGIFGIFWYYLVFNFGFGFGNFGISILVPPLFIINAKPKLR